MPGSRRNSINGTPKKENKCPTKSVKYQDVQSKETSITPRKRKAPEPSPNATPVKSSLKQNTPQKKRQKTDTHTPQKDEAVTIVKFDDAEVVIEDMKQLHRASKRPDLEKIDEDGDDDETLEALSMYGKYGKTVKEKKEKEENDDPEYGFATPKKNAMIDRTNLILLATKKTPVSKAMERGTPNKRSQPTTPTSVKRSLPTTPTSVKRSLPSTPTSTKKSGSAMNTPLSKLKLRGDAPDTPKTVRKRISKKIKEKLESSSSEEEESDDERADSDNDASDEENKSKEKQKSEAVDTDDFFEKQGSKEINTSDKTLGQLKTPRLSPELLRNILQNEPLKYENEIETLNLKHKKMFRKWMHLLCEGFNVLLYGFGSKKKLLNEFQETLLNDKDCVVINGFFPSLTMKHVLGVILTDILEFQGTIGASLIEQSENIYRAYSGDSVTDDL